MEKDRTTKVVAICALLLAVVGVSLGFAAFSQNLKISSTATVTPSDNMYIYFASDDEKTGEGEIVAEPVGATPAQYDNDVEHKAVIDNSNNKAPTITGLRADFTAPGQSVTYSFYAYKILNLYQLRIYHLMYFQRYQKYVIHYLKNHK